MSKVWLLSLCGLLIVPSVAFGDFSASPERSDAAVGHYSRARALLVEALEEFEKGRTIARPDLLIDPDEWRLSIISRTEELNRVLDPKPRITRGGVRFKSSSTLIGGESTSGSGTSADRPRGSSSYGEEQRTREMEAAKRLKDIIQPLGKQKDDYPLKREPGQLEQIRNDLSDVEPTETQKTNTNARNPAPEEQKSGSPSGEETMPSALSPKSADNNNNGQGGPSDPQTSGQGIAPVGTPSAGALQGTSSQDEVSDRIRQMINERIRKGMEEKDRQGPKQGQVEPAPAL